MTSFPPTGPPQSEPLDLMMLDRLLLSLSAPPGVPSNAPNPNRIAIEAAPYLATRCSRLPACLSGAAKYKGCLRRRRLYAGEGV